MKIKTIFFIFCILLATTWCEAASVTQANMRISAVDGTAFVDFSAAGTLTPYIGWYVKVYDSTGKTIEGYIKAGGTGEGLDTDLITVSDDRTFTSDTGWWSKGTGITINDVTVGKAHWGSPASLTGLSKSSLLSLSCLYKTVFTVSNRSTGGLRIYYGGSAHATADTTTDGTYTLYGTQEGANLQFYLISSFVGTALLDADDISISKVLTPSTTGVTITSTLNGTLYNWAVKTTGFNYNDSSGYTYTITATGFTGSTTGKLQ